MKNYSNKGCSLSREALKIVAEVDDSFICIFDDTNKTIFQK